MGLGGGALCSEDRRDPEGQEAQKYREQSWTSVALGGEGSTVIVSLSTEGSGGSDPEERTSAAIDWCCPYNLM